MDTALILMQKMGAPPLLRKDVMDDMAIRPPLPAGINKLPNPSFTSARTDKAGRGMPQAIAHRGYKAKFPENTMGAFRGAVEIGVHALETDVHLSKDGVVVLSHDATLKRCFGIDKKILDCEWKYLKELKTTREPHEALPSLKDLLEYLAQPGLEKKWLLLDIKLDNDPRDIMRLMAETVRSVTPAANTPWNGRIILGCWAAKYIPLCHEFFQDFPITNIGFSIPYSSQFFAVPNVSFNMLQAVLTSPSGRKFIRECRQRDRKIYSWTVNDVKCMDWCIRKQLDGVITDDPKLFLEICEKYDAAASPPPWSWTLVLNFLRINFFAWIFGLLFWQKHGFGLDQKYLDTKTTSKL